MLLNVAKKKIKNLGPTILNIEREKTLTTMPLDDRVQINIQLEIDLIAVEKKVLNSNKNWIWTMTSF